MGFVLFNGTDETDSKLQHVSIYLIRLVLTEETRKEQDWA
jgi:hypothetical protein